MAPVPGVAARTLLAAIALGAVAAGLLGWSYMRFEQLLTERATGRLPERVADPEPGLRGAERDHRLARARDLLEASDYVGAVAELDRALEAAPGDAEALALQVRAFRAQRLYDAARSAAARILERFPHSPLAHLLLASISLQEGDSTTARRDLERALELDTSSALPLSELARIDLMEGRIDDGIERARQALSLDPESAIALRVLAAASRSAADLMEIHERLLEITPDDPVARSWLNVLAAAGPGEMNVVETPLAETVLACERGEDGRLYVRAEADGLQGLRLLVDTGASGIVLEERVARRLGHRLSEPIPSVGLGGEIRHSHPILIDRLRLGAMTVRRMMATASLLTDGVDGILNPLLLAAPGTGRVIEIRPGPPALAVLSASPEETQGWIELPYLSDGNHVIIGIVLGDRPARALLDTGAAADLMDASALRRVPQATVISSDPAELPLLIGFAGPVRSVQIVEEVALRIAGRSFPTRRLLLLDLNEEPFRFGVDLDAVVGIERLAEFDIRIDPGAGRVRFRPLD